MAYPFSWEKFDAARRLTRNETLFIAIFLSHCEGIGGKFFLYRNKLSDRETINGCLPQTLEWFRCIARQDYVVGIAEGKEVIKRTGDNQIQI